MQSLLLAAAMGVTSINATFSAAYDYFNVKDYGAVGNGVANDTAAIQAAINAAGASPVYLPKGTYLITAGLNMPNHNAHGGLVGDGVSASVIQCSGSGYTGLTTRGASGVYRDFSIVAKNGRSTALNGIFFNFYGGRADIRNVVAQNFNGFGMSFEAIWDSSVSNIVIENSGNASNYAFSVTGGTDTSNHTVFDRIQVETSNTLAMFVDANSLCLTFHNIHSERTTGVAGTYTHVLGANRGTYENVRIEATSNVSVLLQGGSTTFSELIFPGEDVDVSYGVVSTVTINNLQCDAVRILSSNLERVIFNGLIANSLSNDYGNDVQVNNGKIGNVTNSGNGAVLKVYDSSVTGTVSTSGVNTIISRQSTWTNLPTVQNVFLDNCTVSSAYTTQFGQKVTANGCTFAGAITLSNNGAVFSAKGCIFNSSLNYVAGTAYGVLDGACVVQGTVNASWYGVPTAGTWMTGQRRYNPTAGTGAYTGAVCTAGGTPGTWKQFGLVQ